MMCDNSYNFAPPCNNGFYYHYLQQHAALSYHFQKMHSNIHQYRNQSLDVTYNPADIPYNPADMPYNPADMPYNPADMPYNPADMPYNPADMPYDLGDYSSSCSCSSCSTCCSSESCSKTSSEYEEEQEEMDSEEGYDEEQYEDEDYDEDESECEYEFNADVILAMRAAKEELKKLEQTEAETDESSKDDESSDSKNESGSKSDSVVLVDSDKDDFEFIDLSSTNILDNLYKDVGKFNKTQEEENKKAAMEFMYGSQGIKILHQESALSSRYEQLCDDHQPSLWPVLPLRL